MQVESFNNNIPENFFYLLTGKNRGFYARVLVDIMSTLDSAETFNIEKATVLSIIDLNIAICAPDEDDDLPLDSSIVGVRTTHGRPVTKEYAYSRIRRCGWIIEEESDDLSSITVAMSSLARLQISSLMSFITTDEVYIGNFRNTLMEKFSDLLNRKCARPYMDAFKIILECCEGINAAQTRIHDNIRKRAAEILRMSDRAEAIRTIHESLEDLNTGEAQKLLITEGIFPAIQLEIADAIRDIRNDSDMLAWLSNDLMRAKSYLKEEDAVDEIVSGLRKVQLCLCINFNKKVNELGAIKGSYIDTVMSKLRLLSENGSAYSNRITRFLMHLSTMDDKQYKKLAEENADFRKALGVRTVGAFTSNGLYPPRVRDDQPAYEEEPIEDFMPLPITMPRTSRMSVKYTNSIAESVMNGRKFASCFEIDVSSREKMNDLVALIINSYSSNSTYTIEFNSAPETIIGEGDEIMTDYLSCEVDGNVIPQFIIRKKEEARIANAV